MLLVLHGGVNRCILSWALGGPGSQVYAQFEQSAACINIVDGEPGDFVLRAVNLTVADPVHLGRRITSIEAILEQYLAYRQATRKN
jgi:probable phosphoglycerate mutase